MLFWCGWGGIDNLKWVQTDLAARTDFKNKLQREKTSSGSDSGDDDDEWDEELEAEMAEAGMVEPG